MDTLNVQNLKKTLEFLEKPAEVEEKVWMKLNKTACGIIRSRLTHDLKYDVINETSAKSIWEILARKYLTKNIKNRLHLKRRLYRFQLTSEISISDHINNCTKFLADLTIWM